jgi:hypothetical protein
MHPMFVGIWDLFSSNLARMWEVIVVDCVGLQACYRNERCECLVV